MEKVKKVLKEMYIGIIIWTCFFLLVGAFVMRPYWIFLAGCLAGMLGAGIWLYSMYDVLDRALDMNEKSAKAFVTIRSVLGIVVVGVIMAGAILIHWAAFVGVVVGFISLKLSAMINPLVRKILNPSDDSEAHDPEICPADEADNHEVCEVGEVHNHEMYEADKAYNHEACEEDEADNHEMREADEAHDHERHADDIID